jgi:hypothetical protein
LSGVLRCWSVIVVAALSCHATGAWAHAAPPGKEETDETVDGTPLPETWPADWPPLSDGEPVESDVVVPEEKYLSPDDGEELLPFRHSEREEPASFFWPSPRWLGLRHSTTHGRHIGHGRPLTGTSWRNRPYYVGAELGPVFLDEPLDDNVSDDVDAFGGVFIGYDFDHYWGMELRFDWTTPEFKNSEASDAKRTDSLFMWSESLLYYPWGDTLIRPYWRAGIGNVRFDVPLDDGTRHDEWLLTFPFGVGVKYPVKRWLVARAELCDHLAIARDRFPTQHNVTLTLGLEWRFGARPRSYWPWNPDRHIW